MNARLLPDASARRGALDLGRHVLVTAPAGSGKTGLLVLRMLLALAVVDEPEQVVAITFTNKAAAEIRHRVAQALAGGQSEPSGEFERQLHEAARAVLERDRARGWNLAEHPARIRALTMDALNAQMAAQAPLASGLGGRMNTSEDARALYQQAVLRLFAQIDEADSEPQVTHALHTLLRGAHNRLDRLMGPLCDLLERREQWLPQLFAAQAAGWRQQQDALLRALLAPPLEAFDSAIDQSSKRELIELLHEGSGQHPTLAWAAGLHAWPAPHPAHAALYRRFAEIVVIDKGALRSPKGINVTQGFIAQQAYTQRMKAWLEAQAGNEALACAGKMLLDFPDGEWPPSLAAARDALILLLPRLAAELRLVFGETGQADFGEVAQAALSALRPQDHAAGGGYSDASLRADARIQHLLVDEMQDTSLAQIRLLETLTSGWDPGDGHSLFLVGDPQQSIYGFRKAEVQLFLQLQHEQRLGQLPLHTVQLSSNFRSAPAVVNWFNDCFARIFPQRPDADAREVAFTPSGALRAEIPHAGVAPRFVAAADDEGEAVAGAVEVLLAGPGGSIGLLARTRAQLAPALSALRRRGIAYSCQDVDPLAGLPAVRGALGLARALWHPHDHLSWLVMLRAPFVGLSWRDLTLLARGRQDDPWEARLRDGRDLPELSQEGRARIARLLAVLDALEGRAELRAWLAERAETAWHALGGDACVSAAEKQNVASAFQLLRTHTPSGELADLPAFERALAKLYGAPAGGAVEAMTVHKAKGLEFDHVLLLGCERGPRRDLKPPLHLLERGEDALLVPAPPEQLAEDDPAHRLFTYVRRLHAAQRRSETVRLLYVAVTRARATLQLFLRDVRDKRGRLKVQPDSFGEWLRPVLSLPVTVQDEISAEEATPPDLLPPPLSPRLPLDYRPAPATPSFEPRERRTLKPSEAVLEGTPQTHRQGESNHARLIGTLYHLSLEKILREGSMGWRPNDPAQSASLAAGFRRLGLPEPEVASAVNRVLDLVGKTVAGEYGRWLLKPRTWARSEYALSGYLEGRWIAARIDRCFEEDDGALWIVDYKTAPQPIPSSEIESYAREMEQRYRDQLATYAALLREHRSAPTIRTGLYFPDADRLLEV